MTVRVLVNGSENASVPVTDRGLSYGDGLFETIWLHQGHAPLWSHHMARLEAGCHRLHLPQPDPERLWRDVQATTAGLTRAVVRVTWTRGSGPRGYAMPAIANPTCIVSAASATMPPREHYGDGILVRWCKIRWATQPALAGMKHLNRLEQVLARGEWHDRSVGEGLMLDMDNHVISATAANIFAVCHGRLNTPTLEHCGVAGVARAEVLAHHPDARVTTLTVSDLYAAEEVFLTSAVRGIVPVRALAQRQWPVGPVTRALQSAWQRAGLPPQVETA